MKSILHKAQSRGLAEHGWLTSRHTFSFGHYHNPERVNFGALRVLNDDIVQPGQGFGTHPHRDMEIVSIPLRGQLQHRDSMGNGSIIRSGEVQIMSAGTGVTHSEFNASDKELVNFLQIWVFPRKNGAAPRYGQRDFAPEGRRNQLQTVVAPEGTDDQALPIGQDAWFSLADLDPATGLDYALHASGQGLYVFVVEGSAVAAGQQLARRDGLGVWQTEGLRLEAGDQGASLLLLEVPMG